jgi:hypothetical protein
MLGPENDKQKVLKNGKYDCYIKRTTDNVLQFLLQASRWRVKTANTIATWNAQLILLYLTNFSLT